MLQSGLRRGERRRTTKQEEWNQSVCISLEEPNLPSECESTTDLPN